MSTDDGAEARERFAGARVARLATADADGRPHLVPVVFAVDGDTIYSVVDAKPKRTTALRRLANVRENPRVTLLVDHYDDATGTRSGGCAPTGGEGAGAGRARGTAARRAAGGALPAADRDRRRAGG